jgi:para-nitrobenzyl esterase
MRPTSVKTPAGSVLGLEVDGVHSFRGIPYAEAPFGDRAFQRPAPVRRWDGRRDCTRFGDVVPQAGMIPPFGEIFGPRGRQSADCLNLNVWTPDPGSAGLPVAVWLHGGGFYSGSGSDPWYHGTPFARAGVVTITLNYRLGVFGFLDVDELFPISDGCQGNAGLADVLCALHWVQQNVESFGGDPHNVTVFGQSAGAMLIAALMASPAGSGLFRRAILQSGAGNFGISRESAEIVARALLEELGVETGDLDGFLRVPASALFEAQMNLRYRAMAGDLPAVFPPGCDDWLIPMQPVVGTDLLPRRPLEAIASGSAADVSIIVGSASDEMRIFSELTAVNSTTPERIEARAYRPSGPDPHRVLEFYRRQTGDRDPAG